MSVPLTESKRGFFCGLVRSLLVLIDGLISFSKGINWYRVTKRVRNKEITAKLHILSTNILAGYLKASEVTWISAIHTIFSHPPAHSGPICFSKVENLKLTSGTNKSK